MKVASYRSYIEKKKKKKKKKKRTKSYFTFFHRNYLTFLGLVMGLFKRGIFNPYILLKNLGEHVNSSFHFRNTFLSFHF